MIYIILLLSSVLGVLALAIRNFSQKIAHYAGLGQDIGDFLVPNWAVWAINLNLVSIGIIIYIGFDIGFFKALGVFIVYLFLLMVIRAPRAYCKNKFLEKSEELLKVDYATGVHLKNIVSRIET